MEKVRITLTSRKQYKELKQLLRTLRETAEKGLSINSGMENASNDETNFKIMKMCYDIEFQVVLSKEVLEVTEDGE